MLNFLLTCLLSGDPIATVATPPPNIVIVYVDDMGWGDLPSQGATGWKMPNLKKLENGGTRFTHFTVAQPVCSASRAALLTGCYPNRIGIHGALGPWSDVGLHENETTLAELAKSRGYATGVFGKWHLGYQDQFLPTRHGFDEYLGIPYSNDMWPGHPERPKQWPPLPLIEGDETIEHISTLDRQDPLTARLTRRAVRFIDEHHDEPFLLYVPHPQPHVPLACGERWKGSSDQGMYGDVMQEIDWSVGEILNAIDKHGIADNTLVMFASDNGPWLSYGDHAGTTGGLREGKGTTFEGGVRVPCVMRWPGTIPAGHVNETQWGTINVYPTIARAIGADITNPIDGADATRVMTATEPTDPPQDVYLCYYRTNELQAIRSGRWKLHFSHGYRSMEGRPGGTGGVPNNYTWNIPQPMALYDLASDPAESTDVHAANPEVMKRMLAHAESARQDLGDALNKRDGTGRREPGRVEVSPTP